jgi:transcriptional regulator NrdR family protein
MLMTEQQTSQATEPEDKGLCCPNCGGEFHVVWGRPCLETYRRRLECQDCGKRVFSREVLETPITPV